MHFVTTLQTLYKYIPPSDLAMMTIISLIVEIIRFVWHFMKTILLIEPCQQTQNKVSDIKMLVGQIMCLVKFESDPLLGATEAFFQQIMLNESSYTVMDICSLKRYVMSTIVGGATTIILIFTEI
ncbi:uncharacterized protein LOC124533175 [Vanessa cardui]|uniref:uncharacterized protein LOC124533175 n=1 Tax=Vanessa cardui TaxID=171605 RepID=UPI001F139D8F|nr:uncharacterized protein LOC124533175 [Vanessa cardui]